MSGTGYKPSAPRLSELHGDLRSQAARSSAGGCAAKKSRDLHFYRSRLVAASHGGKRGGNWRGPLTNVVGASAFRPDNGSAASGHYLCWIPDGAAPFSVAGRLVAARRRQGRHRPHRQDVIKRWLWP